MDNELDFSTKIGMIEVQKRCFPIFFFLFFEGGLGELGVMGISQKTISLNSHLTFVHIEERKIRVFQSYMNLFKSCNTYLGFLKKFCSVLVLCFILSYFKWFCVCFCRRFCEMRFIVRSSSSSRTTGTSKSPPSYIASQSSNNTVDNSIQLVLWKINGELILIMNLFKANYMPLM